MAEAIPPRIITRNDSVKRQADRSALDTLLQMGFPEQRCLKALAATGDRGVQLASDWLLSHVNDPSLDIDVPREYILYLCPVGPLQSQLTTFWDKSLRQSGWNAAHNYFPHITLCSFYTAEDKKLSALTRCLEALEDSLRKSPGKLPLELFAQKSFIGLMVLAGPVRDFLDGIVTEFGSMAKEAGVKMEGMKKSLHITLAHQYPPEHHQLLEKLALEINLGSDVRWDFRLYSRDPRLSKAEVRKVIKSYQPVLGDELEMIEGDYIFLMPNQTSPDGWYTGTSWLTGNVGVFPHIFTQRTAETWIWTLHRSLPVSEEGFPANGVAAANGEGDYDNVWATEDLYAKVVKKKKCQDSATAAEDRKKPRSMFVMRHGERCDFVFSRNWCDKCFDANGKYTRTNLNLPRVMVKRKSHIDFQRDAPLTEVGRCQARLTGEALKEAGVRITHVFVSPALRCVQTAQEVIRGAGLTCRMCVEPTMFEWCGWYKPSLPNWIPPEQLVENGFSVDPMYSPFISSRNLNCQESVEEYYNRCASFSKHIIRKHDSDAGNILMVGHAGSLDVCLRQLCGKQPRSSAEFHDILCQFPYCCLAAATEDLASKRWTFKEPPIPSISHGASKAFSWKVLL